MTHTPENDADDWPVCWCPLSPGYGHLWHPRACPADAVPRDIPPETETRHD
jgi:hypothetical protein